MARGRLPCMFWRADYEAAQAGTIDCGAIRPPGDRNRRERAGRTPIDQFARAWRDVPALFLKPVRVDLQRNKQIVGSARGTAAARPVRCAPETKSLSKNRRSLEDWPKTACLANRRGSRCAECPRNPGRCRFIGRHCHGPRAGWHKVYADLHHTWLKPYRTAARGRSCQASPDRNLAPYRLAVGARRGPQTRVSRMEAPGTWGRAPWRMPWRNGTAVATKAPRRGRKTAHRPAPRPGGS